MLKEDVLGKVVGGLTQKELIAYINNSWKTIPEEIRNKIIDTYVTSGKAAACKLIKFYIEKSYGLFKHAVRYV